MREVQAKLKVVSIRSRFENPTRCKVVIEAHINPFMQEWGTNIFETIVGNIYLKLRDNEQCEKYRN